MCTRVQNVSILYPGSATYCTRATGLHSYLFEVACGDQVLKLTAAMKSVNKACFNW